MSSNKIKEYINSNRRDFANNPFNKEMVHDDPIIQYERWFEEALENKILDPYAACLSTVDDQGKPSSRILYIRDLSSKGFIFYTNFNSKKGSDLIKNKFGSLNVFWPQLERQIRIQGIIEKVDAITSDKYFSSRPRSSQIGAWASNQSEILTNREELESKIKFYKEKFKNIEVPRPPFNLRTTSLLSIDFSSLESSLPVKWEYGLT